MLSWPDALCEALASGGRHVVRTLPLLVRGSSAPPMPARRRDFSFRQKRRSRPALPLLVQWMGLQIDSVEMIGYDPEIDTGTSLAVRALVAASATGRSSTRRPRLARQRGQCLGSTSAARVDKASLQCGHSFSYATLGTVVMSAISARFLGRTDRVSRQRWSVRPPVRRQLGRRATRVPSRDRRVATRSTSIATRWPEPSWADRPVSRTHPALRQPAKPGPCV
jgi:hypothetical protein